MAAAPVALNRDQVRAILSLYHLEGPDALGGLCPGKPTCWVQAAGRKFFLRVSQNRRADDMIFEKDVLAHLQRCALPVPSLVRNVAQGTFTPWSVRGRYVSLFDFVPGRPLGVFELRAEHARGVGRTCARVHNALSGFTPHRPYARGIASTESLMARLDRGLAGRRLARRFEPDLNRLRGTIETQVGIDRSEIPVGTIHGDMGVSSFRFDGAHPVGIVDFVAAGTHRWTWDLASAVLAWGWAPSTKQCGGPAGLFDSDRVNGLLRAYDRARPLSIREQAILPDELRLCAAHNAVERLAHHDLARPKTHSYRDYRHFTARLDALADGAAERMVKVALG